MGCPKPANRAQLLVGLSSPYCKDIWRRYCCLTSFFPLVDKCISCEDIARRSCAMVLRWRFFASFLHPVFPASCLQQISDLHSKFTLGPHHVSKYGRSNLRPLTLGEEKKEDRKKPQGKNIMVCSIPQGDHKKSINNFCSKLNLASRHRMLYNKATNQDEYIGDGKVLTVGSV